LEVKIAEFSNDKKNWVSKIAVNPSLLALIVLIIFFSFINPHFFTLSNLFNILDLASLLIITSLSLALVLMMGSIDLSVEGVVGLCGVIASLLVKNFSNSNNFGFFTLAICGAVGASFGFLSGFILSRLKIPSFMVTLGIGYITTGFGVLITRGNPVVIIDWTFRQLSIGKLGFLPFPFILALFLFFVIWFLNERTTFGRYILAMGGDEIIVQDLGIPTSKIKTQVFLIGGFLYGIVGALLTARLGSGDITAPLGFTFDSIGSCVLGGIAITGGVGNIPRALIGVFILTILRNGMVLMSVSPYVQQGIIGVILITTVALTIDRKKIKIMK